MKRHKLTATLMLVPMIVFCSCAKNTKNTETVNDKIYKNFSDIKSYTAKCKITIHSQRKTVYSVTLDYFKKDNTYKMSYNDTIITIKDDKAKIEKSGSVYAVKSSSEYIPMFVNEFFRRYYTGEESSLSVSKIKSPSVIMLETKLGENDKNAYGQKMWLDAATAKPIKSEIYREDGSVYLETVYKTFVFK